MKAIMKTAAMTVAMMGAMLLSTSSFALGPGYNVNSYSGTSTKQYHINSYLLDLCGPSCMAGGAFEGEPTLIFTLGNEVDDNYDCSDPANTPTFLIYEIWQPNAGPATLTDLNATTVVEDCDLTTDANGEIKSGWIKAVTDFGGVFFTTFFDWETQRFNAYIGNDPGFTIAVVRADPATPGFGILYDSAAPLGYLDNTSENAELAKSVPVPAFAAAALGLGLVAITFLTSRRRKVS